MEITEYYPLFAVMFYVGMFLLIGVVVARKFLKQNPAVYWFNQKQQIDELVEDSEKNLNKDIWEAAKNIEKTNNRQEEISFILCGFAIISLVFLISTFKDLSSVEIILGLFSFAFIFEIISAFLYHHMESNYYSFSGMVFQYGGLLAILLGFTSFLLDVMNWSLIMHGVYVFGMAFFLYLSVKEILIIHEYSQNIQDSNNSNDEDD